MSEDKPKDKESPVGLGGQVEQIVISLPDATARIFFSVRMKCPYCSGCLDLTQDPYDKNKLVIGIFDKMQLSGLELKYACNHCGKIFRLNELFF